MKTDIHPKYAEMTVKCSCGNTFTTGSTKGGDLTLELCNECHPFFTDKQKLVDTGGRVERFQRRAAKRAKAGKKVKAAEILGISRFALLRRVEKYGLS